MRKRIKRFLQREEKTDLKIIDNDTEFVSDDVQVVESYTKTFQEGIIDTGIEMGLNKLVSILAVTTDQKLIDMTTKAMLRNKIMMGKILDAIKKELT